jgi:hypothetical protein
VADTDATQGEGLNFPDRLYVQRGFGDVHDAFLGTAALPKAGDGTRIATYSLVRVQTLRVDRRLED